jgi:hypothetical protein
VIAWAAYRSWRWSDQGKPLRGKRDRASTIAYQPNLWFAAVTWSANKTGPGMLCWVDDPISFLDSRPGFCPMHTRILLTLVIGCAGEYRDSHDSVEPRERSAQRTRGMWRPLGGPVGKCPHWIVSRCSETLFAALDHVRWISQRSHRFDKTFFTGLSERLLHFAFFLQRNRNNNLILSLIHFVLHGHVLLACKDYRRIASDGQSQLKNSTLLAMLRFGQAIDSVGGQHAAWAW